MTASGHTVNDDKTFQSWGISPHSVQPRERAVSCMQCQDDTWNLSAYCDLHYRVPGAVRRKVTS